MVSDAGSAIKRKNIEVRIPTSPFGIDTAKFKDKTFNLTNLKQSCI